MIANPAELIANRTSGDLQTLRRDALEILDGALRAVDAKRLLDTHVRRRGDLLTADGRKWDLDQVEKVRILAAGKASIPMVRAVLRRVEPDEALVVTQEGEMSDTSDVVVIRAAHPIPSEGSLEGGKEAIAMAERSGPGDLFIVLLSGGGSAMLEHSDLRLDALQDTTRLLLRSGMDIGTMNVVRKHLSRVKGGWLGKASVQRGGAGLTLALSDVVGDVPTDIASGPTVPDPSTFQEARQALVERNLWEAVPEAVREMLTRGIAGEVPETPKASDSDMDRFPFQIIGSIANACEAAVVEGQKRGYATHTYGTQVAGEARTVAQDILALAISSREEGVPLTPPGLLVAGGETTFEVRGRGAGGRNLELVLATVRGLRDQPIVFLSCDTDGRDGETDVAGALADGESLERALKGGWEPETFQAESDSYGFFSHLSDAIRTGPTGTNVMDLQIVLIGPPPTPGPT